MTNRQLTWAAAGAALLLVGSIFTTWAFFTNTVDRSQPADLATENESLREVNRSFEENVRELKKQLADFEGRTRQLAIVAGLDGGLDGSDAGVGGEGTESGFSTLESLGARAERVATDLDRVGETLDERVRWISSTPVVTPLRGIITSGFGYRNDPIHGRRAFHQGIDISTAPGKVVQASADGVVVRAGWVGSLGKAVYVSHGYGITTRYGHLSKVDVEPGQRIRRGDTLGYVGSTGRATGYHLHYEVRVDGKAADPLAYILDATS